MTKKENNKKEVKKVKKQKINYATSEQKDVKSFIAVIVVVLLAVGAIWLCTKVFVTKDLGASDDNKTEETAVTVNYDTAIVGNMLSKPESEYYVLVYASDGEYASDMSTLETSYEALEKHLHVYTVDLTNKLNSSYYDAENENKKGTSVDDFKFGDITLVKVKDGKVSKYITDLSKMKKELGIK